MSILLPTHPAVRALVEAINHGDRDAFAAQLAPYAELTDDGTRRDLGRWIDDEIFAVHGRLAVREESADGLALLARFRNDTAGERSTRWNFTLRDGKIGRIDRDQLETSPA
ncbi:hypothetical protein GCM10027589_36520 [Actinocorallia lasiicapitis]